MKASFRTYLYALVGVIIIIFMLTLVYYNTRVAATGRIINQVMSQYNQNPFSYIDHNQEFFIGSEIQRKLAKNYLKQYFMPWSSKSIINTELKIKTAEYTKIKNLSKSDSYGINFHKHSLKWSKKIIRNMEIESFPNLNMRGMIAHDTNLRELPTVDPAFANPDEAGEGYPFDYLQSSFLPKGLPIHVYHISKNGKWCLITTGFYFGWIKTSSLAFVPNVFAKKWIKSKFIIPVKDDKSMYDKNFNYVFSTRIGSLYPLLKITPYYYDVLTIVVNPKNRYAKPIVARIAKVDAVIFPLQLTTKNVAAMIDQMEDYPYGWGEINGYRDCSTTTRDLFATFGIWLPRTAFEQVDVPNAISLEHLTNPEKNRAIIKDGIPFLTLIHVPGHILLYIGHKNDHIYVFHNMWGLLTSSPFQKQGRAIVGRPVITALSFGSQYHNVPRSFLDDVNKMLNIASQGQN